MRGLELPVCQLITWNGKRGGGTGVSRKSEGREMKEKMKERMTQRGEGMAKGG